MPELIKTRKPKARKNQWCDACQAYTIAPGQTYRRDTNVYDGRIYDWVTCLPCDAITQHVFDWCAHPEEGITTDSYQEWAHDHQDDPSHGQDARDYLKRTSSEIVEES